jgi:hypothetical protein
VDLPKAMEALSMVLAVAATARVRSRVSGETTWMVRISRSGFMVPSGVSGALGSRKSMRVAASKPRPVTVTS